MFFNFLIFLIKGRSSDQFTTSYEVKNRVLVVLKTLPANSSTVHYNTYFHDEVKPLPGFKVFGAYFPYGGQVKFDDPYPLSSLYRLEIPYECTNVYVSTKANEKFRIGTSPANVTLKKGQKLCYLHIGNPSTVKISMGADKYSKLHILALNGEIFTVSDESKIITTTGSVLTEKNNNNHEIINNNLIVNKEMEHSSSILFYFHNTYYFESDFVEIETSPMTKSSNSVQNNQIDPHISNVRKLSGKFISLLQEYISTTSDHQNQNNGDLNDVKPFLGQNTPNDIQPDPVKLSAKRQKSNKLNPQNLLNKEKSELNKLNKFKKNENNRKDNDDDEEDNDKKPTYSFGNGDGEGEGDDFVGFLSVCAICGAIFIGCCGFMCYCYCCGGHKRYRQNKNNTNNNNDTNNSNKRNNKKNKRHHRHNGYNGGIDYDDEDGLELNDNLDDSIPPIFHRQVMQQQQTPQQTQQFQQQVPMMYLQYPQQPQFLQPFVVSLSSSSAAATQTQIAQPLMSAIGAQQQIGNSSYSPSPSQQMAIPQYPPVTMMQQQQMKAPLIQQGPHVD